MELGVQLFGVLANTEEPLESVLSQIREMGYTRVEPCLALEPIPVKTFEQMIWSQETFEESMEKITAHNLAVDSVHIFGHALNAHAKTLCALAKTWGIRAFVVKVPEDPTDLQLQETAIAWMTLADALQEAGAELLIHNEAADIAAKKNGKTLCEHMLDLCQGRVGLQVDVGWVLQGGEDPVAFLRRNRDKVRSVHFKDLDGAGNAVTVGEGLLPLEACFAFARARGLPQIIDQDSFAKDPFEDLQTVRQRFSALAGSRSETVSYLNVMDYEIGEIRTLAKFDRVIEAPNWMRTTGELVYNAGGLIYAWKDGRERKIDTGLCTNCNNDHVLSPKEDAIAVSHMVIDETGFSSRIYIVPFDGTSPGW